MITTHTETHTHTQLISVQCNQITLYEHISYILYNALFDFIKERREETTKYAFLNLAFVTLMYLFSLWLWHSNDILLFPITNNFNRVCIVKIRIGLFQIEHILHGSMLIRMAETDRQTHRVRHLRFDNMNQENTVRYGLNGSMHLSVFQWLHLSHLKNTVSWTEKHAGYLRYRLQLRQIHKHAHTNGNSQDKKKLFLTLERLTFTIFT